MKNILLKLSFFVLLLLLNTVSFCETKETYVPKELFSLPKSAFTYQAWEFDDQDNLYSLDYSLSDPPRGIVSIFDKQGKLKKTILWPEVVGIQYRISVDHDGAFLIWNFQRAKCYWFGSDGKLLESFLDDSGFDDSVVLRDGTAYSETSGKILRRLKQSQPLSSVKSFVGLNVTTAPRAKGDFEEEIKNEDKTIHMENLPQHYEFYNYAAIDEMGNIYVWICKTMWGDGYRYSTTLPYSTSSMTQKYDKNFNFLVQIEGPLSMNFRHRLFAGPLFVNRRTQSLYGIQTVGDGYKFIKYEKAN